MAQQQFMTTLTSSDISIVETRGKRTKLRLSSKVASLYCKKIGGVNNKRQLQHSLYLTLEAGEYFRQFIAQEFQQKLGCAPPLLTYESQIYGGVPRAVFQVKPQSDTSFQTFDHTKDLQVTLIVWKKKDQDGCCGNFSLLDLCYYDSSNEAELDGATLLFGEPIVPPPNM